MRACSFLPAATKMIYDMGLQDLLYGVTSECPAVAADKLVVVRCMLEDYKYSSMEVDRIFSASKASGKSLYYVEEELLELIAPDVIFTQDVCEVCQIDTACTPSAIARLPKQPALIALTPESLEDVFSNAFTVARALGREDAAHQHVRPLRARIDSVTDQLRNHHASQRSVMIFEWMDPVYNCGHWIPHQVVCAGGLDMLANPGGDSMVTDWGKILNYDPEVIVIAPCGYDLPRTRDELSILWQKKGWAGLRAVRNKEVYMAGFDLFTQPSPGTLTDGIELLAALFHPEIFTVPAHLELKYQMAIQNQTMHV